MLTDITESPTRREFLALKHKHRLERIKEMRFTYGMSLRAIGEAEGISRERVRQYLGNTGRGYAAGGLSLSERQKRQEQVAQLLKEGYEPQAIAVRLGITDYQARIIAGRCGWKPRAKRLAEKGLKRCGACKEPKPLTAFGRDKTEKDGLNRRCIECNREATREYHRKKKAQEAHE